jgi:hypothetical protein
MSKGPGVCQRCIIGALTGTPAVELQALLGKEATRPQRLALQRAARVLADKGCIRIFVFWDVATQKHVYVLHRIDYDFERHARAYGLTPYANNCDWIRAATASRGGAGIRLHPVPLGRA